MSKCALCKTSLKDDEINVCDKCRLDFLNFKQQLAEKDKEIRKQVCNEIKRKIANLDNIELSSYMTLCDIIDKIEQGEQQ